MGSLGCGNVCDPDTGDLGWVRLTSPQLPLVDRTAGPYVGLVFPPSHAQPPCEPQRRAWISVHVDEDGGFNHSNRRHCPSVIVTFDTFLPPHPAHPVSSHSACARSSGRASLRRENANIRRGHFVSSRLSFPSSMITGIIIVSTSPQSIYRCPALISETETRHPLEERGHLERGW